MKKYFTLKKILLALLVVVIAIQLVPVNRDNPPVNAEQDFITMTKPTPEVAAILKSACYDCHSNETRYPWYSRIAPVSWWLKDHINEGREELNFSVWGTYKAKRIDHKLKEAAELVNEGEMPMDSYTWMHADARLTADQKKTLTTWFTSLRSGTPSPVPAAEEHED